jgi:hypothetical protein
VPIDFSNAHPDAVVQTFAVPSTDPPVMRVDDFVVELPCP